jgi:formylglycine-generating enzyme required for sulfatase activity
LPVSVHTEAPDEQLVVPRWHELLGTHDRPAVQEPDEDPSEPDEDASVLEPDEEPDPDSLLEPSPAVASATVPSLTLPSTWSPAPPSSSGTGCRPAIAAHALVVESAAIASVREACQLTLQASFGKSTIVSMSGASPAPLRPSAWMAALACVLALAPACGAPGGPPPIGQALVVVDTDLPVPKLAGRLRVDFYTPDGIWYDTRDLAAPRPPGAVARSDWPVSFAVTLDPNDANAAAKDVVLRLRAYPEGKVRDYLGELYQARPSLCDTGSCESTNPPPPACCPLLVPATPPAVARRCIDANGDDITPTTEPAPLLTVDQLVLLHLEPGVVGKALVVLRGACIGTMADVRSFSSLATCTDTENVLAAPATTPLDPDLTLPPSVAGSFEQRYASACTLMPRAGSVANGIPLHDEEACVTGGGFVLGGPDSSDGEATDALPERTAFVTSFLMDRYEVTVARYRDALAHGYQPPEPIIPGDTYCDWTSSPGGAEQQPLNCITPEDARAFCRYAGGSLPTEAQWEYAATMAGRDFKTHYPWGDGNGQPPGCGDVVYGRSLYQQCASMPSGPANVDAAEHDGGDVTPAAGGALVDLGGNVAEITYDSFAPYASNCWLAAGLVDPSCRATSSKFTNRGASWADTPFSLLSTNRNVSVLRAYSEQGGFRCVRPGVSP